MGEGDFSWEFFARKLEGMGRAERFSTGWLEKWYQNVF